MSLRLSDQLCFPFYAIARGLQQRYRPFLEPLGLTYPQYLVMLVLWEGDGLPVGALADRLHLDAATVTPLLKRLDAAGLVRRTRDPDDNRVVRVHLTARGTALRARAEGVPGQLYAALGGGSAGGGQADLATLKSLLDGVLHAVEAR